MELKIFFLLTIVFPTSRGCLIHRAVETILVNGQSTTVCKRNDVKYLAGQKFRTSDCYECICDASFGLLCCGFGRNLPRYDFVGSEGCDILEKDCLLYYVKKDDHSLDCFNGGPLLYDIDKYRESSLKVLLDQVSGIDPVVGNQEGTATQASD